MKKILLAFLIAGAATACGDNASQEEGSINSDQTTTDTSNSGINSGGAGLSTDTSQTVMGNTTDSSGTAPGAVPDSLPNSRH